METDMRTIGTREYAARCGVVVTARPTDPTGRAFYVTAPTVNSREWRMLAVCAPTGRNPWSVLATDLTHGEQHLAASSAPTPGVAALAAVAWIERVTAEDAARMWDMIGEDERALSDTFALSHGIAL